MWYAGERHGQQGQGGLRNRMREVKSVQDQIRKGFQEEKRKTKHDLKELIVLKCISERTVRKR